MCSPTCYSSECSNQERATCKNYKSWLKRYIRMNTSTHHIRMSHALVSVTGMRFGRFTSIQAVKAAVLSCVFDASIRNGLAIHSSVLSHGNTLYAFMNGGSGWNRTKPVLGNLLHVYLDQLCTYVCKLWVRLCVTRARGLRRLELCTYTHAWQCAFSKRVRTCCQRHVSSVHNVYVRTYVCTLHNNS